MISQTETEIIIRLSYKRKERKITISKRNGEFKVTNPKGRKTWVSHAEAVIATKTWNNWYEHDRSIISDIQKVELDHAVYVYIEKTTKNSL